MFSSKIECDNGWIVFVVNENRVIEVHSSGVVTNTMDDRAENNALLRLLVNDAIGNELHTQQSGYSGVLWPYNG